MPKRLYPRPLIYEALCGEMLIDPIRDREAPVGAHHDIDGDGLADHDPAALRARSSEDWCEDRADPASWDDPDIVDEPWEVTGDAVAD